MKVRIEIEGDTSDTALAAVLAALAGNDEQIVTNNLSFNTWDEETAIRTGTETTGPVSQPGASAPMPTAPSEPTNQDESSSDEFDSTGQPWDENLHASTRTQNKDGTWKKRKGGPVPNSITTSYVEPEPTTAPVVPPMPPIAAPVPSMTAVPPMPAPVQASDTALTFTEFMAQLGPIMGAGKIDVPYLQQFAATLGLNAITDLNAKPELIGTAVAMLQAEGRWS